MLRLVAHPPVFAPLRVVDLMLMMVFALLCERVAGCELPREIVDVVPVSCSDWLHHDNVLIRIVVACTVDLISRVLAGVD